MATHVALLRAVNLGAHNKVAMRDLCALVESCGLVDARSLLQSGNVVFTLGAGRAAAGAADLERLLEKASEKKLGVKTDYFVRTAKEWKALIAGNPFKEEAARDPSHLLMVALKDAPAAAAVRALQGAIAGRETVAVKGRHAYIAYRDGIGRSPLTMASIEKKLGTRGTGRNWNTVLKLAALIPD
jgi:uncharacterized protein (DUF1697 family)